MSNNEIQADRQAWLTKRQSYIGASEVAAVLGQDPYKSTYQLWAEKCGLAEPDDLSGNEFVKWGTRLEQVIAEGYADETGREVDRHDQTQFLTYESSYPVGATPDFWQRREGCDDDGILEVKAPGARMASEWDGDAPLHYQIQLQCQLLVTGCTWGTVAALIDRQLVWFDYERNVSFCVAMLAKVREFWELVQSQTPPPVDGSPSVAKVLYKLHPNDNGATVDLPPISTLWDRQIRRAKDHIKRCQAIINLRENQIKEVIGDATFGESPDGFRYSWKHQARTAYQVEATETRVLRRHK